MNAANVIALLGVLLGGGGGATLIARLTRLAIAAEALAESHRILAAKVAGHETRLDKGGL